VTGQEPIPPEASRQDVLGRLRRERWHAQQAGESARVDEIDRQIAAESARSAPRPPARETTSANTPARERRATPPRRKK
jgi:hypothetical protein